MKYYQISKSCLSINRSIKITEAYGVGLQIHPALTRFQNLLWALGAFGGEAKDLDGLEFGGQRSCWSLQIYYWSSPPNCPQGSAFLTCEPSSVQNTPGIEQVQAERRLLFYFRWQSNSEAGTVEQISDRNAALADLHCCQIHLKLISKKYIKF